MAVQPLLALIQGHLSLAMLLMLPKRLHKQILRVHGHEEMCSSDGVELAEWHSIKCAIRERLIAFVNLEGLQLQGLLAEQCKKEVVTQDACVMTHDQKE
jgi:hypothetical protein